ncbi:MAG: regulatory protein RecX [Alphaproteobacteria bacterium]|nr:regulatory protein RecX [Alphaproteobacteria bacterium]
MQGRKTPRRITESYLHNAGLYYLQRFSASSGHFREVMLRKIKRSCHAHTDQDFEACVTLLDALILRFQETGLLNDEDYARMMVRSLRQRGHSRRLILLRLGAKGLPQDLIQEQLVYLDHDECEDQGEAERQAALVFARKKRFGPYAADPDQNREKAMASMARAGFSYDTIQHVLSIKTEDL